MSKPYESIEARGDGYLWLVGYEPEETEQQPLLLHAASDLMKQLKEKWHEDMMPSLESALLHQTQLTGTVPTELCSHDDDVEMEDVFTAEDVKEDEAEKPVSDDDVEMEDSEEANDHDDAGKGDDHVKHKKRGKPKDKSKETKPQADYSKLERTLNLSDQILTTLTHIRMYKHDDRKRKRDPTHNHKESKIKALQHQRDRLQQQKEQQKKQADAQAADINPQKDGGDNFQVVGKKENDNDDEASTSSNEPQDPHVRLVRTLNSIRALTPVLLQMLAQPDRERKDLRVGPKNFRLPKRKKATWWLIGNHVFDFATATSCKSIQANLQELLEFLLPRPLVKDLIDGTIQDEQQFWCQEWLKGAWVSQDAIHLPGPYDILAEFVGTDKDAKASIVKQCEACDEKFFAKETENQKDQSDHKLYQKSVQKLHKTIARILERDFHGARLSIYGSCLSNLSLKASDVDLSLYLPQAQKAKKSFQNGFWSPNRYEKEMTKLVREVWRRLVRRQGEFSDMVPVTRARVPVVKGCFMHANNPYTEDGSLHFDICFLNDIAVANSSLLREYSLVDDSVRELMVVVKKWAKDNKVCAAQDNTLSSYAWLNMVVFYLQCIRYVPNLQCPNLMEQVGHRRDPNEYWHSVNDLDTCYLTLEQAKQVWKRPEQFDTQPVSNTSLLYGFFNFYTIGFVRSLSMVSIKRGSEEILPKTVFRKCSPFFCIEDPFETFDSHMPHDLGIPVNEPQTRRIFELIRGAEEHLRGHLLGDNTEGGEMTSLWPWPPVKADTVKGQTKDFRRRHKGGGRNNNKDNSQQVPQKDGKPQQQQKGNHPNQTAKTQGPGKGRGGNTRNQQPIQNNNQKQANGKSEVQEPGQKSAENGGAKQKQGNQQNQKKGDGAGRGGGGGRGQRRRRGGGKKPQTQGQQEAQAN